MSRLIRTFAVLSVFGLAVGCSSGADVDEAAVAGARSKDPAHSTSFWVDPASPAAEQIQMWEREGRTQDAALLKRIAEEPAALWRPGSSTPAR